MSENEANSNRAKLPPDQWIIRVTAYADGLAQVAERMVAAIAQMKTAIESGDAEAVQDESRHAEGMLKLLEGACEKRTELLGAFPAAEPPRDLRSALRQLDGDAEALASRLDQIGSVMAETQRRATALFIANYHLLETRNELLRLITTGTTVAPTYDRPPDAGATLLDRAA